MKLNKKFLSAAALIILFLTAEACSYSFTGTSVPPHLKTIYILNAKDKTGSGISYLGQYFTEKLIDNFVSDNNLKYIQNPKADAKMDCSISTLSETPVSVSDIQSTSNAENISENLRKVTISVKVVYRDQIKRKTLINKSFSNQFTFNTSNYETNREAAIKQILDKIAEDILLGAVSNW